MFSLCSPPDQIHTGFQLSRTGSPSLQAQSGIAADLPQAHKTGKDLKLCPISRHILRKCTFQFQGFSHIKHPLLSLQMGIYHLLDLIRKLF